MVKLAPNFLVEIIDTKLILRLSQIVQQELNVQVFALGVEFKVVKYSLWLHFLCQLVVEVEAVPRVHDIIGGDVEVERPPLPQYQVDHIAQLH